LITESVAPPQADETLSPPRAGRSVARARSRIGAWLTSFATRTASTLNFTRSNANGYSFVYKQPKTAEERVLCDEALVSCPVEAIGDDG